MLKHYWAQPFRPFLRTLRTLTMKWMPTSIPSVFFKQFLFYEPFSAHFLETTGYQNNEKRFEINVFYSFTLFSYIFFLLLSTFTLSCCLFFSFNNSNSFLSSSFLRSTFFSSSFFNYHVQKIGTVVIST